MSAQPTTYTRTQMNALAAGYQRKLDQARQRQRRYRAALFVLLAALPVAFAIGRGTAERGMTVRQLEATVLKNEERAP